MGRGVSCGGGQSSLSYLFGSGEPATNNAPPAQNRAAATNDTPPQNHTAPPAAQPENNPPAQKPSAAPPAQPIDKDIPAGIQGSQANNYLRADGQNCGNFITDRPSTKVHAAPGGGSSLGYLFGGDGK